MPHIENTFDVPTKAVVTGGSSGIGHAVVLLLAESGCEVLSIDRHPWGEPEHPTVRHAEVDLRDEDALEVAVNDFSATGGPPGILVNCAAIVRWEPFLASTPSEWHEVLDVNLLSALRLSQIVARIMVQHGSPGRIVNVSSIHASVGEPGAMSYTASKGALESASRTMAAELARHSITVNCIRPGATYTGMTEDEYTPQTRQRLQARIPLGRIADPEDIADLVGALVSRAGRYCTGAIITVDGGLSIMNDWQST